MTESSAPHPHHLLAQKRWVRRLLFIAGWISFALGMIGLLLPLVPTTPFLLLTCACFVRSSPRFYRWLLEHRWFGRYVRYYVEGLGIPQRVKQGIVLAVWTGLTVSALVVANLWWHWLLLASIGIGVTTYVWRQPTLQDPE